MRVSDAGLRQRESKLLYPDHRLPPWPTEDAIRDRSNRWLGPPLPDIAGIRILRFTEEPESEALKNLSRGIGFA
jgi:hypothetical protein